MRKKPFGITVPSTCARLVIMAAGAAAGKFLQYETGAPTVAAQTAYGIEAEVTGYSAALDPTAMTFMDFRRHHTGLWPSTTARCTRWPPFSHRSGPSMQPRHACLLLRGPSTEAMHKGLPGLQAASWSVCVAPVSK